MILREHTKILGSLMANRKWRDCGPALLDAAREWANLKGDWERSSFLRRILQHGQQRNSAYGRGD